MDHWLGWRTRQRLKFITDCPKDHQMVILLR
jgi:hypothetical protein